MSKDLEQLKEQLNKINEKLDNHITHIVADISAIRTDISWLKEKKNGRESKDDIKTQEAMDWVKKIIFIVVAAIIGGIFGMIARFL